MKTAENCIRPGVSDDFLLAAGVEVLPTAIICSKFPIETGREANRTLPVAFAPPERQDKNTTSLPVAGLMFTLPIVPLIEADELYGTEGEFKTGSLA